MASDTLAFPEYQHSLDELVESCRVEFSSFSLYHDCFSHRSRLLTGVCESDSSSRMHLSNS